MHKPCETEELVAVLRDAFEKRVMRRLKIGRDKLETLVQQMGCTSSLEVIRRLKDIEMEVVGTGKPEKLGNEKSNQSG